MDKLQLLLIIGMFWQTIGAAPKISPAQLCYSAGSKIGSFDAVGAFRSTLTPILSQKDGLSTGGHEVALASRSDTLPWMDITGFLESRMGYRIGNTEGQPFINLAEARFQLQCEKVVGSSTVNFTTDVVPDAFQIRNRLDARKFGRRSGEGIFDLRQAHILLTPLYNMDIKVGRQIMTWGTGDLLFINDLFAKDFRSFFLGRDDEYLKAPSTMLKFSLYTDPINVDLVYTPRFTPDRFVDGSRISFFDPSLGGTRASGDRIRADVPGRFFNDDEVSVRVHRLFGSYETASYYYQGFWKSPAGVDSLSGAVIFPKLEVYGASLRGPLGAGIASVEGGYYRSQPQRSSARARADEFRMMTGYEMDLGKDLTLGVQYFFEKRFVDKDLNPNLPYGANLDIRFRDLFTIRLTKSLMKQDLKISLFNFFSPTDQDGYLRIRAKYSLSERTKFDMGCNIFFGERNFTFFNQFSTNNNLYFGLRYEI